MLDRDKEKSVVVVIGTYLPLLYPKDGGSMIDRDRRKICGGSSSSNSSR
jgi:hypothetical protein